MACPGILTRLTQAMSGGTVYATRLATRARLFACNAAVPFHRTVPAVRAPPLRSRHAKEIWSKQRGYFCLLSEPRARGRRLQLRVRIWGHGLRVCAIHVWAEVEPGTATFRPHPCSNSKGSMEVVPGVSGVPNRLQSSGLEGKSKSHVAW